MAERTYAALARREATRKGTCDHRVLLPLIPRASCLAHRRSGVRHTNNIPGWVNFVISPQKFEDQKVSSGNMNVSHQLFSPTLFTTRQINHRVSASIAYHL